MLCCPFALLPCHAQTHNLYARAGMLSGDGRCKTFDARANGYARGEGAGAFSLRGTPSASSGVLYLGSRVRSDGKSASLTAPNGKAQARMLSEALGVSSGQSPACVEAHGTGTPLGDPTEMGGLESALSGAVLCMGGAKANVGHTEPVAGLLGLLALTHSCGQKAMGANAQLRKLNPMLAPRLRRLQGRLCAQPLTAAAKAAGVSSFGYSGTIAHAIVGMRECTPPLNQRATPQLVYEQRSFPWREASHPFAQVLQPASEAGSASMVYHSRVHGALRLLVAEHVVQGRTIFPAAGYLEMAHAASLAATRSTPAKLCGVFFLLPLALSEASADAIVAIELTPFESFEVSSTSASGDAEVHSSGSLAPAGKQLMEGLSSFEQMRKICTDGVAKKEFYELLDKSGLNYGPAFRAVESVWTTSGCIPRVATLRSRKLRQGTNVHPADLDGALQLSVANLAPDNTGTRLPFAVDDAHLLGHAGSLSASVEAQGQESNLVALTSGMCDVVTRLDGFKARELRAAAKREPWYTSDWLLSNPKASEAPPKPLSLLLLSDDDQDALGSQRLGTSASQTSLEDAIAPSSAIIFASALQRGVFDRDGLHIASAALTLLQLIVSGLPVWFFTAGTLRTASQQKVEPVHAGAWGLGRTARAEVMLQVRCVDVDRSTGLAALADIVRGCAVADTSDPEAALRAMARHVPRLAYASQPLPGTLSLAYLPRGALSNLTIEPQPAFASEPSQGEAELCVRAVGLNFRDVLNVLGEYPGDPGPPGIDCAGIVMAGSELTNSTLVSKGQEGFGLGVGALASVSRTDVRLLARKPTGLSFEKVATLPITWSTVHTALLRASPCWLWHAHPCGCGRRGTQGGRVHAVAQRND